jgi:hypothetical protein
MLLNPDSYPDDNYWEIGQVFWLEFLLITFPSKLYGQWFNVQRENSEFEMRNGLPFSILCLLFPNPYSYGDSAGFTPDFPFNSPIGETKSLQM